MTAIAVLATAEADLPELTEAEARALTDDIKCRVSDLIPRIRTAYYRRADKALGYSSWQQYCHEEGLDGVQLPVSERPEAVAELRQAGMSTRAIGSALGISPGTVRNDLAQVGNIAHLPTTAVGLDGKSYATTQPARSVPTADEAVTSDAIDDVPLWGEPEPEAVHTVDTPAELTPEQQQADAEFRQAVRESAERQQQEVLELLAKQEAVNAFGRACDGLLSAVSYAAAFRPPAEIAAERIDQFISRTERLLETARTWKEQTA